MSASVPALTNVKLPILIEELLGLIVTELEEVKSPSTVLAVIVVDPTFKPVTIPLELTPATEGLDEDQVIDLLVALFGETVAIICSLLPIVMDNVLGLTEIPVTPIVTVFGLTVIVEVSVKLPSCVLAVIMVVPSETADTDPLGLTVAIVGFAEDHKTVLLVAFVGDIAAETCWELPVCKLKLIGETEIPVTFIVCGGLVSQVVST